MCDDCVEGVGTMIFDYVNIGLHLEMAIIATRDSVVQRALHDRAGLEALETALELTEVVNESADKIRIVHDYLPDLYQTLCTLRKMETTT